MYYKFSCRMLTHAKGNPNSNFREIQNTIKQWYALLTGL